MGLQSEPPPEAVALFRSYLPDPALPPSKIQAQLDEYLDLVDEVSRGNEQVDNALAFRIAENLREILAAAPADKLRFVQAAARYFVEDEDANGDLVSVDGFDDDIMVMNAVARFIGRPDLQLS